MVDSWLRMAQPAHRISDKHLIMLDDDLAEALTECYALIKKHVGATSSRDSQVKVSVRYLSLYRK